MRLAGENGGLARSDLFGRRELVEEPILRTNSTAVLRHLPKDWGFTICLCDQHPMVKSKFSAAMPLRITKAFFVSRLPSLSLSLISPTKHAWQMKRLSNEPGSLQLIPQMSDW